MLKGVTGLTVLVMLCGMAIMHRALGSQRIRMLRWGFRLVVVSLVAGLLGVVAVGVWG